MRHVTQAFLVEVLVEGDPAKIDSYFEPMAEGPFKVSLRVRDDVDVLDAPPIERSLVLDVGLALANPIQRMWRLRIFNQSKKNNPDFPVLVSEGDSWFQLFTAHDTIEWLTQDHSILSMGAAGDTLANMTTQNEVLHAIRQERPAALLLSAGGNDFLGDLETLLCDDPDRDFLGPEVGARMKTLEQQYEALFERVAAAEHKVPVICHGYDYARPRPDGKYIGGPIAKATGVLDPERQARIIIDLIDRFDTMLQTLAGRHDGVHFVDLRGMLSDEEWRSDEIHPSNGGYERIAQRFRERIRDVVAGRKP